DEGRARLELQVHLGLPVRPRPQLREADPLAHGVHDRYRGGGHGQRYPAVQGSRLAVADEIVAATRLSPANEPHSRVIHHPPARARSSSRPKVSSGMWSVGGTTMAR